MANKARICVQLDRVRGSVDPMIFGHFTEHAFGNIYGGIYDPGNPLSDEDGQRTDVLALLRRVKTPILRYPGGNFVANYHWEDGIGPKENRKRVFEYAWLTEESNQFGTVDFILECRKIGAEPCICVNMGTGTVEEAMHWVEYCNSSGNTYYANLRRSHGYEEPFGVKYWGLGNELWNDVEMEQLSAEDYAKRGIEFAKAMKWMDPTIKLVVCGLQDDCDWNVTALKKLYNMADYISAHHYSVGWGPFERDHYLQNLFIPQYMEKMNNMVKASIIVAQNDDEKRIQIAWDEWNQFGWQVPGVDDDRSYDLHDALITALVLNFFIKNCDSIGMANYSTFVNINGALSVKKDGVLIRPQYYSFELLANNTGKYLADSWVSCGAYNVKVPMNACRRKAIGGDSILAKYHGEYTQDIPYVDAAVTTDDEGNIYVSLINKHLEDAIEVTLDFLGDIVPVGMASMQTIYADDIRACNEAGKEPQVGIAACEPVTAGANMKIILKKHSVNLLKMKKA